MKRFLLVLAVLSFAAMGASAQFLDIESLFSQSSAGVFGNELDAAATVSETGYRPGFTDLDASYLFAGIANLEGSEADANFAFSAANPLWAGYFHYSDKPWSLFESIFANFTSTNATGGIVNTIANKGVGADTYDWISQSDDTKYTANRVWDNLELEKQFLFTLSDIITGVYLGVDINNANTQANNYVLDRTVYYDNAGVGVIPAPLVDYTLTRTQKDFNVTRDFALGVPIFKEADDKAHTATVELSLSTTNNSLSDVTTRGDTSETALGVVTNETEDGTTDKTTTIGIDADYTLTLPPKFGDHEENELSINFGGMFMLETAKYEVMLNTQNFNYAGAGAAATAQAANLDETSVNFKAGMDFGATAGASHSFYFEPGPNIMFGFIPDLTIDVARDGDLRINQIVDIDRTDGNADGDFADAGDTISTTTFDYTNTTAVNFLTGAPTAGTSNDLSVDTTVSLPISLVFTPNNWPISITVGSEPYLSLVNTFTTNGSAVYNEALDNQTGAGADAGGDSTDYGAETAKTRTFDNTITGGVFHTIGISINLGERAKIDVSLDASAAEGSIWDFSDFVMQAIVKLEN